MKKTATEIAAMILEISIGFFILKVWLKRTKDHRNHKSILGTIQLCEISRHGVGRHLFWIDYLQTFSQGGSAETAVSGDEHTGFAGHAGVAQESCQ